MLLSALLFVVFAVGTNFKLLFRSLKVYFVKHLLPQLISWLFASDWSLVMFPSVLHRLIECLWLVLWLGGLHNLQRSCSRFLNLQIRFVFTSVRDLSSSFIFVSLDGIFHHLWRWCLFFSPYFSSWHTLVVFNACQTGILPWRVSGCSECWCR